MLIDKVLLLNVQVGVAEEGDQMNLVPKFEAGKNIQSIIQTQKLE